MPENRVVIVGAGIAGLVAAWDLSARGFEVTVLEKQANIGGKLHVDTIHGSNIDAGPTVFTMRWIFDELFEDHGASLEDHITLKALSVLARHAWQDKSTLDLYAEQEQTADAITAFAGSQEADGFRRFSRRAGEIFASLDHNFMRCAEPGIAKLTLQLGVSQPSRLWNIRPFATLHRELGQFFKDARLRQLFARYATYCGSSPYLCPATLMLVAHAEQRGVWVIDGGMQRLASVIAAQATAAGATFHFGCAAERIDCNGGRVAGVEDSNGTYHQADNVIWCGDVAALRTGLLGEATRKAAPVRGSSERTLSALTITAEARLEGFEPHHHNVFFCGDYAAEFRDIFQDGRLPGEPTVYICAQDRGSEAIRHAGHERILVIINAPANGDRVAYGPSEVDQCLENMHRVLANCGLNMTLPPHRRIITTPQDFNDRFPATGGALYGMAMHGPMAAFQRPTARSRVTGLYLAGGSTHPGAGLPMAATSGRMAAARLQSDRASMRRSAPVAMPGGTSTP